MLCSNGYPLVLDLGVTCGLLQGPFDGPLDLTLEPGAFGPSRGEEAAGSFEPVVHLSAKSWFCGWHISQFRTQITVLGYVPITRAKIGDSDVSVLVTFTLKNKISSKDASTEVLW